VKHTAHASVAHHHSRKGHTVVHTVSHHRSVKHHHGHPNGLPWGHSGGHGSALGHGHSGGGGGRRRAVGSRRRGHASSGSRMPAMAMSMPSGFGGFGF
jgi:hypothetical protein